MFGGLCYPLGWAVDALGRGAEICVGQDAELFVAFLDMSHSGS